MGHCATNFRKIPTEYRINHTHLALEEIVFHFVSILPWFSFQYYEEDQAEPHQVADLQLAAELVPSLRSGSHEQIWHENSC